MDHLDVVSATEAKLGQVLDHFKSNLASLRTGRASASMLDSVMIEAYGTSMPLKQAATITVPEAQLIQITPFDPSNLTAITTSIRNDSSLGLNPADDGRVVRVPVPPLNEERRRDLAKQVGQRQEECLITLRGARHDAIDVINEAKKNKSLGEDDSKRLTQQIEDLASKTQQQVATLAKEKESEIMTL